MLVIVLRGCTHVTEPWNAEQAEQKALQCLQARRQAKHIPVTCGTCHGTLVLQCDALEKMQPTSYSGIWRPGTGSLGGGAHVLQLLQLRSAWLQVAAVSH